MVPGDRRGRGGRGRRQHRLDRRDRRAEGRPAERGRRSGPICYRGGGAEPTITDANLVLGRLDPDDFPGRADGADARPRRKASSTRSPVRLKMSPTAAAQAIVDIAVSKMSLAVREVSVAKGYDPRDFALVASGGAGPFARDGDRARVAHPQGDRAALPRAFLRLACWLADERHDFIRPSTPISAQSDFGSKRTSGRRWRPESAFRTREQGRSGAQDPSGSALTSARNSRFGASTRKERFKARTAGPSGGVRTASTIRRLRPSFAGGARGNRHVRLRRDRQAREDETPAPSEKSPREAFRKRRCTSAIRPPGSVRIPREELGAGARLPGCSVREHGTTTVLFTGDVCSVAATGELLISVRGAA